MNLSWGQFLLFIADFGWSSSFPGTVCCVMNNSKVEKEEGGESHYLGKAETSKKVQSLSALAGQMLMPFINITEH